MLEFFSEKNVSIIHKNYEKCTEIQKLNVYIKLILSLEEHTNTEWAPVSNLRTFAFWGGGRGATRATAEPPVKQLF